jgi:hypothetical protein
MTTIITPLRDFIRNDFSPGYYLTVVVILGGGLTVNYGFHFKKLQLDAYFGTTEQFFRFLIFFSSVYFFILFVQAFWKKDFSAFKNKSYLVKIFTGLLILSFDSSSRHIYQWITTTFDIDWGLRRWFFYLFTSIHQFINLGVLMFILKYIFDRYEESVYGLTLKNFDVKPYFTMLLFMMPLIAWASFQNDFLHNYPIYKDNFNVVAEHIQPWKAVACFELSYAFRFVAVELFFRGFLIIGMIKLIGERAIMPMVVLYSFWHFGKPMPESIGAAFGGYILGVIALRTRSVFGGIIVHIGVAMMMEVGAYINLYLLND